MIKKGRKPKSYYENLKNDLSLNGQEQTIEEVKPVKEHKKRGRKPKGGIVVEQTKTINTIIPVPNIILHLNCKSIAGPIQTILNVNNIQNKSILLMSSDFILVDKASTILLRYFSILISFFVWVYFRIFLYTLLFI